MLKSYFIYIYCVITLKSCCASDGPDVKGKVISGDYATIKKYPHAVFLEIRNRGIVNICGSSVLNQYFLLSVAHCFDGSRPSTVVLAYAGSEDISKTNIVRRCRQRIVHERYDDETAINDIALLFLERKIPLGENIQKVILKPQFPYKNSASLAGWGIINEEPNVETVLLKSVRQTVRDISQCSNLAMLPGMFCAGSRKGSDPRPAQGDSGSGLVNSNYEILGILSYQMVNYPALPIYTNVTYFYKWIYRNIKRTCEG